MVSCDLIGKYVVVSQFRGHRLQRILLVLSDLNLLLRTVWTSFNARYNPPKPYIFFLKSFASARLRIKHTTIIMGQRSLCMAKEVHGDSPIAPETRGGKDLKLTNYPPSDGCDQHESCMSMSADRKAVAMLHYPFAMSSEVKWQSVRGMNWAIGYLTILSIVRFLTM